MLYNLYLKECCNWPIAFLLFPSTVPFVIVCRASCWFSFLIEKTNRMYTTDGLNILCFIAEHQTTAIFKTQGTLLRKQKISNPSINLRPGKLVSTGMILRHVLVVLQRFRFEIITKVLIHFCCFDNSIINKRISPTMVWKFVEFGT